MFRIKVLKRGIGSFLLSLATLAGTIIGVGIFSLPYAAAKAGFWPVFFYFLILGAFVILLHLIFGEVVLRTKGKKRLPGYAEKYLGKWGKRISFLIIVLGLTGALLAYIIVGGAFLSSLLSPTLGGSEFFYSLLFFSAGAMLIYFGIKSIAKIEFIFLILFLVVLLLIFGKGFSFIELGNLFSFNAKHLFLPYGLVLFSLWGMALVPEVREMLKGSEQQLKRVISLAIILSAITYLLFVFIVLGITGPQTSMEAISGLALFFGNGIVSLAFCFGILTCFTSFLTLGLTLKKVFWYDFKIPKDFSWVLACFVPLSLFLFGLQDFIKVISLTGGIMLGAEGIVVILMYLQAKTKGDIEPAYSLSLPRLFVKSLILFLILGITYEIFYFVI